MCPTSKIVGDGVVWSSYYEIPCLKKNQSAPRPSELVVVVVVFFTLTDRASTIPSNTRLPIRYVVVIYV